MAKKENSGQKPDFTELTIPEVYTNTGFVNFSPYEFELTLGMSSSNYSGTKPTVNIRMSPQFAKEFVRILTEHVAVYEENIGKIDIDKVK